MSKIFDSHIHFNMKANNPIEDFKNVVEILDGFILILNSQEEKEVFQEYLARNFKKDYPLSAIALNYELFDVEFTKKIMSQDIKLGVKLHPRLSNITVNDFEKVSQKLEELEFNFIIIDCFYYGSSLKNHINLELSIYIANYFKNTNIILAHSGGHKVLEYMLYTRDLKNVYYDFSLTSNYLQNTSAWIDLLNFMKFNYKKVFFGSDYPDFTVQKSIDIYKKLFQESNLHNEQIDLVFTENILYILNNCEVIDEK